MSGGTMAEHQGLGANPEFAEIARFILSLQLDMAAGVDPSNPAADEPEQDDTEQKRYEHRNACILMAMGQAIGLGYACGFAPDPAEPGWMLAYIELPTGQVSWHLPAYTEQWDGHSTEEKYRRVEAFRALTEVAVNS